MDTKIPGFSLLTMRTSGLTRLALQAHAASAALCPCRLSNTGVFSSYRYITCTMVLAEAIEGNPGHAEADEKSFSALLKSAMVAIRTRFIRATIHFNLVETHCSLSNHFQYKVF